MPTTSPNNSIKFYVGSNAVDKLYVAGSQAWSAADVTAPSTPTNFRATGTSTSSVSLAWNASSDNVGVSGYRVYRSGSLYTSTASLSTTVSGLSSSTSYSFGVEAYDAAGNTSGRAATSATTSTAYPYLAGSIGQPNIPNNVGPGTYNIGSFTFNSARQYYIVYYGYCAQDVPFSDPDYVNAYCYCAFNTSIGTGSGPGKRVDQYNDYRYETGTFGGVGGYVTFSIQIFDNFKANIAGSPSVEIWAAG